MSHQTLSVRACLGVLTVAVTACAPEASARAQLEQDGFTDVELSGQDSSTFTFRAKRSGNTCDGEITQTGSFGFSEASIRSSCRPPAPVYDPRLTGLGRAVDYAAESGRDPVAVVGSEEDPTSLAARAFLQALIAADRQWIWKNGVRGLHTTLLRENFAELIAFGRWLGDIRLMAPTIVQEGDEQIVAFEMHHTGGAGREPFIFKLGLGRDPLLLQPELENPRITSFYFSGPGADVELAAVKQAPRTLSFLGAFTRNAHGAVYDDIVPRDVDNPQVYFVVGGLQLAKDEWQAVVDWDIERLADGAHNRSTQTADGTFETPAFLGLQIGDLSAGRYRLNVEVKDVHSSATLRASHPVRIVESLH